MRGEEEKKKQEKMGKNREKGSKIIRYGGNKGGERRKIRKEKYKETE